MTNEKAASIASAVKKFMRTPGGGWWKVPATLGAGYIGLPLAMKVLKGGAGLIGGGSSDSGDYTEPTRNAAEDYIVANELKNMGHGLSNWGSPMLKRVGNAAISPVSEYEDPSWFAPSQQLIRGMQNQSWEQGGYEGPVPYPEIGLPKKSSVAPLLGSTIERARTFSPSALNQKLLKDKSLAASSIQAMENRS